jgi:hypothetical protein
LFVITLNFKLLSRVSKMLSLHQKQYTNKTLQPSSKRVQLLKTSATPFASQPKLSQLATTISKPPRNKTRG